jgi:PAS domain S-box-containing protein
VTPEVLEALRQIVAEIGADAGVLVRLAPTGSGVVMSSTLSPAVTVGDIWGAPAELAADPDRLAVLVPEAARPGFPAPVTAALVAPVAGTKSRIVLLWAQSRLPPDVVGALESGAFALFTLLAPVLDAQVQAEEAASRLRAVVSALDQAVVLTATGSGPASVNDAAAQLLGLPTGSIDTEVLSDAMRALRDRAVDPTGLTAETDRLLASSAAVVRDWVWALRGMPSHLRVTSLPVDTVTGPGRVWVFDDISAEMGLVESERRTGRALAESEQRYRMLAENVSDVVVQGSNEGVITWVSPSVTTTMGWTPDDLVGRNFRDLVHPADRGEVVAGQEKLARGERASLEVRLLTAGGAHRWMNIRVKPVLDATGRMVGRIAGWWDAQASHEAIEQLARSESRYRLLLENSNDVVFQAGDGVLAWVSPTIETVTGWPTEELVGRTTAHLWHPDDVARAAGLREAAQGGAHVRDVLRFRHADGNHLWMEVTARPFSDPAGRPGVVGMMHDVTDRVLAQEAARASEERYRLVAENASDVVCRYDAAGIIDWVFGSTEALAGRSAAELVGTPALAVFMAEDLADRDEIRAQLVRGEAVQRLARLRRPDGSTRWVEARAKALVATDGSIEYVISTWRDAQAEVEYRDALAGSERQARELADAYRAARNEAIEASTAKTAFLSRMSHELRTPLNAVLGFAQLLALDPLTAEQVEAVEHIRTGGRHLLDLINEVLDISRIEAGRLSLSMEVLDAAEVLAEAVDLVRPLAQQYDVPVGTQDPARRAVRVFADRQRVRQVLLNLMSNAVKYNRPGGHVVVGCREGGPGEVVFEVTDTGPGIADELLPRLFQPFDRLGAENSGIEGTGIGLALADGLARAMAGRIEVSTQVGVGSTFVLVAVAATEAESDGVATAERETVGRHDADLNILYIEDNPTNATLMTRVVSLRQGCRLEVAADGARGLAAAQHEPPDLVFLDLHLPDLSGEEVLQRLRALPGCGGIPVVVVTADASPGARERMLELGSDGFLTKPIDLDDVLGWIDGAASGRSAS